MSPLSKAMREKILRHEGALTEDEAAACVGAKTLAQFRRWYRADMICGPIPGTSLWNRDDLYRSIAQLRPSAEYRLGLKSKTERPAKSKREP
jgi:hypothetical protein